MKIFTVDSFTDRPFSGNPAAVCLLDDDRDSEWLQAMAAEMNLSETAFLQRTEGGFSLRWFTPSMEVDLCGHATLAAAHILYSEGIVDMASPVVFQSRSGPLTAAIREGLIELDFPATPAVESSPPEGLLEALGVSPTYVGRSKFDKILVVESEETLRGLQPDFALLAKVTMRGAIVTSPSNDERFDFVSRYFAPAAGIDEDPVTGSAHCCLAPYWGAQLGRTEMTGYQASQRGGIVHVRLKGDRVFLRGSAIRVLTGSVGEACR